MLPASPDIQAGLNSFGIFYRPRRPLPFVALGWIAGMIAGGFVPREMCLPWLGATAFASAILTLIFFRRSWSLVPLCLALVSTGSLVMMYARGIGDPQHIRSHVRSTAEFATVQGLVKNTPILEPSANPARMNVRFEFEVRSFKRRADYVPSRGQLDVFISGADKKLAEGLKQGDLVSLRGACRMDTSDPFSRGRREGFLRVSGNQIEIVDRRAGNPLAMLCMDTRDRAANVLGWGLPEGDASATMTRALLLGLRSDVDRKINDAFAQTGTLHILSLSGTHIGILVLIMVILLKSAGVSRPSWVLFFLPVLALYTIATGGSASTVRATVMAVVYFLAYFLRRRPDGPSSLAFSALLILAYDPLQLFEIGFVLSFVIVAGLIGLYRPVMELLRARKTIDPAQPEVSLLRRLLGTLWQKIIESFGISIAAWLASLPLIVNLFNLVSPVALVINLLLVPLTFMILLAGCLSLAAGLVSFHLASVFNHANWVLNESLIGLVDWAAECPGSYFYVRPWPWFLVLAWYGMLVVFAAGKMRARWAVIGLMSLAVTVSVLQRSISSRAEISIIPLGSSVSVLVDGPGDRALLIDTGNRFRSYSLVRYLRSRGINQLDEVWLSRATSDAYGGLADLLASMRCRKAYVPDISSGQASYRRLVEELKVDGMSTMDRWPVESHFEFGDLIMRVLHPGTNQPYINANQSALVLAITREQQSVIFMSTASSAIESELVSSPADFNSRSLIVGSMGGMDGLGDAWLDRVSAREVYLPPGLLEGATTGSGSLMNRLAEDPKRTIIQVDDREPIRFML